MTSDDFFRGNTKRFDIVFIDGLHTYEQARKDFINSLRFLNDGGAIILHDMLPTTWEKERVPRLNRVWNGTVWKLSYEFAEIFKDRFCTILADNGLGVVFYEGECDLSRLSDIDIAPFKDKNFGDLLSDYRSFNLVPIVKLERVLADRRYVS